MMWLLVALALVVGWVAGRYSRPGTQAVVDATPTPAKPPPVTPAKYRYDPDTHKLIRRCVVIGLLLTAAVSSQAGNIAVMDPFTKGPKNLVPGVGITFTGTTISANGVAVPISIQPWSNISTAVRGRFTAAGGVSDAAFAAYTSMGRATLAQLATKSPVFANATTLARFGAGPTYNGSSIGPGVSGTISSSTPTTFANDTILGSDGTHIKAATISDVARTGAYADLTGTPSLATVATSGAYADLTGTPSIPAAQVNSDWNSSTGVSRILNKPTLATVATSGAYTDLTGKPALATVATTGSYTSLTDKPAVYTLPTMSTTVRGGAKVDGTTIVVDGNGVISSTVSAGVSTVNGGTGDVTVTPENIGAATLAAFSNYTGIDRVTVAAQATTDAAQDAAMDTYFGNGVINVRNAPYNIVGDLTTDNTAAIQTAINDAITARKALYFPDRYYKTTATLTATGKVHFIADHTTFYRTTDFGDTFYVAPTDPVNAAVEGVRFTGINFQNGGTMTSGAFIHTKSANYSHIDKVKMLWGFGGVYVEGGTNNFVNDITIESGQGYTSSDATYYFKVGKGVNVNTTTATGLYLTNFEFTGNGGYVQNGIVVNGCDGFYLTAGHVNNVYGSDLLVEPVSNSMIVTVRSTGVYYDGDNTNAADTVMIKGTTTAAYGGITFYGGEIKGQNTSTGNGLVIDSPDVVNVKVDGTTISGLAKHGVDYRQGGGVSINNATISHNNRSAGSYNGVNVGDGLDGFNITGNNIGTPANTGTSVQAVGLSIGTGCTNFSASINNYGSENTVDYSFGSVNVLDAAGSLKVGSRTVSAIGGDSATLATIDGTPGSGNCAQFDAAGNIVDAGAACGTTSGGITSIGTSTPTSITGILKGNGSTVSAASAGTDYVAPAGNVATATALAANGTNCSAGSYPLGVDAQGNAEGCSSVGAGGTYPSAGVANSTGSAWGTSYTVGASPNNLPQLDAGAKLPVSTIPANDLSGITSNMSLGSDIVTNGAFTSNLTGWSGANWAYSAGTAAHTAGTTAGLSQSAATVTAGQSYKVMFDISGMSAGTIKANAGAFNSRLFTSNAADNTFYFTAASTSALQLIPSSDFNGAVDNVRMYPAASGGLTVGDMSVTPAGFVGVGTTTPVSYLDVQGNAGPQVWISDNDSNTSGGGGAALYHRPILGAPTANNRLGYFLFGGYDGTAYRNSALIGGYTDGAWTAGSAYPTYLSFATTAAASTSRTEKVKIWGGGGVSINTVTANHTDPGAGSLSVLSYILSGYEEKTASYTVSRDASKITLASGTATVTLIKTLPANSEANVGITVAGAAASGVSFAVESGGSISWGDAGVPTFTNNKTSDVVCKSQNVAATTTAAWRCTKGGDF